MTGMGRGGTALLAILLLAGGAADAAPAGDRQLRECERIEQRIRRIHQRMRAGYSAKQGVKLAAELRRLRAARARRCR